ncbi:MAG: outer membrane beta-barrel protein [Acidobacteria bacterium]|nr:outer membrane beta-barrel protein [Acidobacteriota bacterium]
MIRRRAAVMMAMVCLMAPASLLAQARTIALTAGATAVGPLSGSARQFTTGFGVDLGVTWNIGEQIGLRFDYVRTTLGAKDTPQFPASGPVHVEPRMQFGTADVVFRAPAQRVRIYVTGGVGIYHRSVSLTVATDDPISVCNPWWFVCFPGPVAADRAAATRSTTDFGVNVGAGVAMSRFFAEMRYHYVWGPTFSTPAGPVPATGKFLPLVVGMRF